MIRFIGVFIFCFIAGMGASLAASNAPDSFSGANSYICDGASGSCTCEIDSGGYDCREMLDSQSCSAPENVGIPWTSESDARNNGFTWFDYVSCDRTTGRCTCNMAARVVPGGDMVPREHRPPGLEVFEQPVTSAEDGFTDGSVHTRNAPEMVMMDSEDEEEEMPMGAIHSEEAPPEVVGINPSRDRVVDHRDPSGRGNTTDHRRGNRTDHREEASGERPNEVVPARRGTPPGGNRPETATDPSENAPLPFGLNAPSNLDTSDIEARTVMLHWMDNSTREWGVELHRMDPVAARRTGEINWEFIGNFEERIDSNVSGTGMRSDQDFDLTPETNYCYRLRAYVGFDKSEVSDYSGITCAFTEH